MNPCIAIINPDTLSSVCLRNKLRDIYGPIEVLTYRCMDDFIRDSNRHFIHFFVNADILFTHIEEFETLKGQTTVISCGKSIRFMEEGYHILDVTKTEHEIEDRLMHLQFMGNATDDTSTISVRKAVREKLSEREKEVLILMIKGQINKEIAKMLNISMNTVIFHRNNICEKLQTRSIGKLTIFAVLSGIVDINEI